MHTYQNRDRGLLECFGPQGIATEIYVRSRDLTALPLGFVFRGLYLLLAGLALILLVVCGWATLFVTLNSALVALFVVFFLF